MSIVDCPADMSLEQEILCAVCECQRPLKEMTVGLRGPDGKQAFACDGHFWDGGNLYSAWAGFIVNQEWSLLEALTLVRNEDYHAGPMG